MRARRWRRISLSLCELRSRTLPSWQLGNDWRNRSTPIGQVGFEVKRPLHPGDVSMLFSVDYQKHFSTKHIGNLRVIPAIAEISIAFLLYADNAKPQIVSIAISDQDVVNSDSSLILKHGMQQPWINPF